MLRKALSNSSDWDRMASFSSTDTASVLRSASSLARKVKITKKRSWSPIMSDVPTVFAQKEITTLFPLGAGLGRSSIPCLSISTLLISWLAYF